MGGGWADLTEEVRGGLAGKVTCEQSLEPGEGLSQVDKRREKFAGKKHQKTRERNFLCSRNTGRPVWVEWSELRGQQEREAADGIRAGFIH